MGARSRRKGARGQQQLAKRWRDTGLYPDAYSTQGRQVRHDAGKAPGDIENVPWIVEVKVGSPRVRAALQQAEDAAFKAGDDRVPVAVCRWDGDPWDRAVVAMRLEDFELLIAAQREGWESP
jgi:hypothetical protein